MSRMIASCRPALPLRRVIRYYYQVVDELASEPVLQPVPARSPQILEFMFGALYRVQRLDLDSMESVRPVALVGAQTFRRVNLLMHGKIDAFTVAFQPGGVSALFGVPAEILTNLDFDAEAVLGKSIAELHCRLAEVSTLAERACVADEVFAAALPAFGPAQRMVRAATEVLAYSGCARVADLAQKAGLGLRQFERRFAAEIGIPPKLYSRVVRFEAALRQKAAAPGLQWTDIAHALGYHDQSHMAHDFNRLSGESPSDICSQLDMFVLPEVKSA
jgi:AraC-like DNA-binding protein